MTDPTTPNPQADELVEALEAMLAADGRTWSPSATSNAIKRITADRARIEQLEMALAGVLNCIGDLPLDRWQYNAIVEARTALTSERGG